LKRLLLPKAEGRGNTRGTSKKRREEAPKTGRQRIGTGGRRKAIEGVAVQANSVR